MHNAPLRRLVNENPSASVENCPRMAVPRASRGPQNMEGIAIALDHSQELECKTDC